MHINEAHDYLTTHFATARFWKEQGAPQVELTVLATTRDGDVTLSSVGSTIELAAEGLRNSVDAVKSRPLFRVKGWNTEKPKSSPKAKQLRTKKKKQ